MTNKPSLRVYNHQEVVKIPATFIEQLELASAQAMPMVLERLKGDDAPLAGLDEIEVSLVDDATIADVHLQFMGIPGATDVITFDHGEIHIGVETARRQADEYFQPWQAEVMLYVLHGLFHLAGYEDATEEGQALMDMHQSEVLSQVWPR